MDRYEAASQKAKHDGLQKLERTARLVNLLVPLGWLPLGVSALAEGNALPAILGCLAMTLIGSACSRWPPVTLSRQRTPLGERICMASKTTRALPVASMTMST